jgi:hypothetical protein
MCAFDTRGGEDVEGRSGVLTPSSGVIVVRPSLSPTKSLEGVDAMYNVFRLEFFGMMVEAMSFM